MTHPNAEPLTEAEHETLDRLLTETYLKPSNFLSHPWDSVTQNNEHEVIARNIMVILSRTGDEWRSIQWDEYASERAKDGGFNAYKERPCFERVVSYCASPESAKSFSPGWRA
jgi:hypothetical protein